MALSIALCGIAAIEVRSAWNYAKEANSTLAMANIHVATILLAKDMQEERGLTRATMPGIDNARTATNSTLNNAVTELEQRRTALPVTFRDQAEQSILHIKTELSALRDKADHNRQTPAELFDEYTEFIAGLVEVSQAFSDTTYDAHLALRGHTLYHFQRAIDIMGIERAMLAIELADTTQYTAEERAAYSKLEATKQVFLGEFIADANSDSLDAYFERLSDPTSVKAQSIEDSDIDTTPVDASVWWEAATGRIDKLYEVVILASTHELAHAAKAEAEAKKHLVIATGTLFVAIVVIPIFGGGLNRQMRRRYETEEMLTEVVGATRDGLAIVDADGALIWTNPSAERLLEGESHALPATVATDDAPETVRIQRRDNGAFLELSRQKARWRGADVHLLTIHDMTEIELAKQATKDPLTKLSSRIILMDRLEKALQRLARGSKSVCVLFIDLDRFKQINDAFGHEAGDLFLVEVGLRFAAAARTVDTVARLGGDEFVIICEDVASDAEAEVIGERFRACMDRPIEICGHKLQSSISIGIVREADAMVSPQDVLRAADSAMYNAKRVGGNCCVFYSDKFPPLLSQPDVIKSSLKSTLDDDQLLIHYQPIVDFGSGLVVGVEALLRLINGDGSEVRPADFIDAAEELGVVIALGERVLRKACLHVSRWNDSLELTRPLVAHVNFSASQLASPDVAQLVERALLESGLSGLQLCLEFNEATIMRDQRAAEKLLGPIKDQGVSIAIDHFAAAYSTLLDLVHLPVDQLKIDASPVRRLGLSPEYDAATDVLIRLAHNSGLTVLAEGIETIDQWERMQSLGCDLAQGNLIARPEPPEQCGPKLSTVLVPKART